MKGKLFGSLKLATTIIVIAALVFSGLLLTAISRTNASSDDDVDTSKMKSMLEVNLEKYVNYDVKDEKGVLVELDVKTGIKYEEGQDNVALAKTLVALVAPTINGELPESVELLPISSKATNGNVEVKPGDITFNYYKDKMESKEAGRIEITIHNNPDENGTFHGTTEKDAKDNFKLLLNYGKNCYMQNTVIPENIESADTNNEPEKYGLNVLGRSLAVLGINGDKKLTSDEFNKKIEVTDDVLKTGVVNNKVTTEEIYNGYIKSNISSETKRTTNYVENFDIEIGKKEISDEILIEVSNDFEEGQNTYLSSYQMTKVKLLEK